MRQVFTRVRVALAAASATVALTSVAVATPAAAETEVWVTIPCFSGAIDHAAVVDDGRALRLEWHLDCARDPEEPNGRYGHGLYPKKGEATASGQDLAGYALTAPTLYARTAKLPPGDGAS